MSKKKHKPARPHWERIVSRRQNNKNVVLIPEQSTWYGYVFKENVRPSTAKPGQ